MPVSVDKAAEFARYSRRPETWAIAARRQLALARHLLDHEHSLRSASRTSFNERSGAHDAAYLHSGFAVETAAKTALVGRDPSVVTDHGTLDKSKLGPSGGHGLRQIAEYVLPDLSEDEQRQLDKLQEYVVWAGRYTIPMKADVLFDEERMNQLRNALSDEQAQIGQLVARLLVQAGVSA